MKKIILCFVLTMIALTIGACQNKNDEYISTQEISNTLNNQWQASFPDYADYDSQTFVYARVHAYFLYDTSDSGNTREEKRAFYEQNNETYFNESGINDFLYDDIYISSYSPFFVLTYRSKANLFEDYSQLKDASLDGYISSPNIELNTVGVNFDLDATKTIDDLIDITDRYDGDENTLDLINFTQIASYDQFDHFTPNILRIHHLDGYLEYFSDNEHQLDQLYFENNDLYLMRVFHPSSLYIEHVSNVTIINENKLVFIIEASAMSTIHTADVIEYYYLVELSKDVYEEGMELSSVYDVFYMDGAFADVPLYHRIIN